MCYKGYYGRNSVGAIRPGVPELHKMALLDEMMLMYWAKSSLPADPYAHREILWLVVESQEEWKLG